MPLVNTAKRARKVRHKKAAGRPLNPRQKQQVARAANKAAGRVVELHEHIQRSNAFGTDWTGTLIDLTNAVVLGGDMLSPSSLLLRYAWDAGDDTNICRVLVFQWNGSAAGDPPATSDILDSTNLNTTTAPFAFPERDNRQMYKILFDKVYAVNTNDSRHIIDAVKFDRASLPARMTGVDSTNTVDVKKIYAMFISDSAIVSHPSITYASRLLYHDG